MGKPQARRCEACNEVSEPNDGKTMFRFPIQKKRLQSWVRPVGKPSLAKLPATVLHNARYLCPAHFAPEMFWNKYKQKLMIGAIPTIFDEAIQPVPEEDIKKAPWFEPNQPSVFEFGKPLPPLHTSPVISKPLTPRPSEYNATPSPPESHSSIKIPLQKVPSFTFTPHQENSNSNDELSNEKRKRDDAEDCLELQELDDLGLVPESKRPCVTKAPCSAKGAPRRSLLRTGAASREGPPPRLTKRKIATMSGVSNMTPDVKRMCKTTQQYKRDAARVRVRLELCQRENASLRKMASTKFVSMVDELTVTRRLRMLLKAELENFKRKPTGRKWSLENKLFALAIYKRSPRAYRFLAQHLCLPSESSLKSLLASVPMEPGICKAMITLLKSTLSKLRPEEKNCVVLFDEVYLSGGLYYNFAKGIVEGFEDYGNRGRTTLTADHALVFMVQGITRKWTQPVAYYFVHKTCPAHMLKLLIGDVVKALFDIGFNVLATVSDQGPTNRGAISELHASSSMKDEIIYEVDKHHLVHIYDVPHIFKNIRNNLLSSNLLYEGGKVANFRHIIEYFKLDESMCQMSPLTTKHLNPQGRLKMRVKYAAQTCSCTVAGGMETILLVSRGQLLGGSASTIQFLRDADYFFDLTNGPSQTGNEKKKDQRKDVTAKSLHHAAWPAMIKKLQTWVYKRKSTGVEHIPPCVKGWIKSVQGMIWLWQQLNKLKVKKMRLRCLNQDALENFFCTIRQCCGSSSDVTCTQFTAALKTSLITKFSSKAQGKNCMDDDAVILSDLECLLQECQEVSGPPEDNIQEPTLVRGDRPETADSTTPLPIVRRQGVAALLNKFISSLKSTCSRCINSVTTNSNSPDLVFLKSISVDSCLFPSQNLITTFLKCQNRFNVTWKRIFHKSDVVKQIKELCQDTDWSWLSCPDHPTFAHDVQKMMASLLIKQRCQYSNRLSKIGVFKKTRQILAGAVKDADGLREEEEMLQLHPHDLSLLLAPSLKPQGQAGLPPPQTPPIQRTPKSFPAGLPPPQTPPIQRTPKSFPAGLPPPQTPPIQRASTSFPAGIFPVVKTPQIRHPQTPFAASTSKTVPQTPQITPARQKVLDSWQGNTPGMSPAPTLVGFTTKQQIDALTVPQLKAHLKGKVKLVGGLSRLRRPELLEEMYKICGVV